MARISLDDIENYGVGNSGSYFQLKDDGDNARVRFLYDEVSSITPYVVHEVETGEYDDKGNPKTKYVNCLRNYNEPVDKCPLCAAGYKQVPKLFLKLYNEDVGECQIWERGKTYAQRIANLAAHFNPLCNEIVEISRLGKKGDKQTKYEFLPLDNSEVNLDDYDCIEPLGRESSSLVLDKTAEELEAFLNAGSFVSDSADIAQQRNPEVVRRTPSNTNPPRRTF